MPKARPSRGSSRRAATQQPRSLIASRARLLPPPIQALTSLALREDLPAGLRSRAEKMVHAWSCSLFLNGSEAELAQQYSGRESRSGLLTAEELRAERNAGAAMAAAAAAEAAVRAASGGAFIPGMGVSAAANTVRVASRRPPGVTTKYGVLREAVDPDVLGDWN